MSPKVELLEPAAAAVAAAMGVARRVRARFDPGHAIAKADTSPVTVADFAIQAIVAIALEEAAGAPPLLVGEESAAALRDPARADELAAVVAAVREVHPDAGAARILAAIDLGTHAGAHADGFWTIDPVDGTKGFIRDAQYAIALGRIVHGEVVAAVLGCPNLGRPPFRPDDPHPSEGALFVAERGAGCWQRRESAPGGSGRRVRRRPIDPADEAVMCDSVSQGARTTARRAHLLEAGRVRFRSIGLDSQSKYAMVARGDGDIYLRLPRPTLPVESIWDHAAGTLVALEAGAAVSDLDGKPLDFGRGRSLRSNRGVVACAAELHEAILRGAATIDLDPFAVAGQG
ncbi:MAG TPA: inositol monophosphatase family protein [Phycisphaerales bacterium]|nr:inositol monophosphatase family protein [Phycisphaerales bacterium]HMP36200.1 inositol monophosphatase family protein [Phycisphaerales bacterium]